MKNQLTRPITLFLGIMCMFLWVQGVNAQIKVGYVTMYSGLTADGAADPIVAMLEADPNVDLTVIEALGTDTGVVDYSAYDVVVAQEAFGSKDDIYKRGNPLGMGSINVPFILNKVYTMRDTRGFSDGVPGMGGEVEGTLYLEVSSANQSNDLFKGLSFDGDSIKLFYTGGDDSGGDTRTKGLQYAVDVEISTAGTKLGGGVNDPENATVCINDIPAGDSIGSEKLQARMITMAMNYGAMCKDGGNLTPAGLTIWRNAVYSLGGMAVPAEALPKTKPADFDIAFVIVDDRDAQNYDFLMKQGFNVHLIQPANAAISTWTGDTLSWVENSDLVILGRSMNSSSQQDSADNAMWSMVDVPAIQISPWSSRSSRNHMFNSTSTSNLSGSLTADIHMPADGIFDNVDIPADNKLEWFGVASDILTDASGTSNGEWVVAVGDSIPLVVRFEANKAFYEDGPDSAVAERVYFGMGQEPGGQNYFPLTRDGKQIYLNEVCRILGIDAPMATYETYDYNIAFVVVDDRDFRNYDFLEQNGYNVNVIQPANAAISTWTGDTLSWVENSDLVILGRSMNSSSQQDSADNAMWSMVDVPVIQISPWSSRSSRNHMFNSTSTSNLSDALKADILMPDDAIFNNVTVTGDTMTWFTAASDILTDVSGTSQGEWVVAVGDSIPLVVRFEANKAFYVDGPDSAVAERVYFGMGQEPGGVNYFPLSDDAKQVYLNEVSRILDVEAQEAVIPVYGYTGSMTTVVDGEYDDASEFTFTWDADSVYLTFNVVDDTLYLGDANAYVNDNIEIYFDMDNSKNVAWPRGSAVWPVVSYDDNDYQLRLVPETNAIFEGGDSLEANVHYMVTDDGYMFEVSILWNSLMPGFTAAVGTEIGFDVLISDNDGDYRNQITWSSTSGTMWSDPSWFATVALTDGAFEVVSDTEKPTDPSNVAATADESSAVVTWDPSTDNLAVNEYSITVDGLIVSTQFGLEADNTYTATDLADGDHTIGVTAIDNAGNMSGEVTTTVTIKTISVEDTDSPLALNAYPNPANSSLIVESAVIMKTAQIFNTNGQLVMSVENIDANTININVNELNSGIYNLQVISADNKEVSNLMFIKK